MTRRSRRQWEALDRVLWEIGGPDYQAALFRLRTDDHVRRMRLVNEQFAVLTDGPLAGEIVSVATGKRVRRARVDALAGKGVGSRFVTRWLSDAQRREISDKTLRRIIARAGTGCDSGKQ